MYESTDIHVSHPKHYMTSNWLECIDAINAATEELTGMEAVCTAQIIKYSWRWKKKNGVQDLEKAKWYLTYLIDHIKLEEKMEKSLDISSSEDLQTLLSLEMSAKQHRVTEAIDWYFDNFGHMSIANMLFVIGDLPCKDPVTSCAYGWNDRSDICIRQESAYEPRESEPAAPVFRLDFKDPIYIGHLEKE